MRSPNSLKKEFLKKWISGLQACCSAKQHMSILERKNSIKLSADIAIASARNGRTGWSRALIANASKNAHDKALVDHILGNELLAGPVHSYNKRVRCKKILKKSHRIHRIRKTVPQAVHAKSIAKRMVKQKTRVLKSLVPGGEFMDDISLVEETLDYLVSLQAQVDVMRALTKVTELVNGKAAATEKGV